MSQRIHLAAIVAREGRIWLLRDHDGAEWELPGGPFLPEHADPEAGIDAVLEAFGVRTAASEEHFIETLFLPDGEGHAVYNLYAAADWQGEPRAGEGRRTAWMAPEELDAIDMNTQVRDAILQVFGIRERPDTTAELLARLQSGVDGTARSLGFEDVPQKQYDGPGTRREAGLDVLRTLSAGTDPRVARENLGMRYGPLGDDVVDFAMGEVWATPGLDRRTRSLEVVAMLGALGRTGPLQGHIGGALNHGATPAELVETIRMVAVYAGFPAALDAWQVLEKVFEARGIPIPGVQP